MDTTDINNRNLLPKGTVLQGKYSVDDKSRTMGYVYLGRVTLRDWEYKNLGTRYQMQIRWNMLESIPASVRGRQMNCVMLRQ